jgi:hypothetical protein
MDLIDTNTYHVLSYINKCYDENKDIDRTEIPDALQNFIPTQICELTIRIAYGDQMIINEFNDDGVYKTICTTLLGKKRLSSYIANVKTVNEKRELEISKLRYDVTISKFVSKTKYWPLVISTLSILISIFVGWYSNRDKPDYTKVKVDIKSMQSEVDSIARTTSVLFQTKTVDSTHISKRQDSIKMK